MFEPRTEYLVESTAKDVELRPFQATALEEAGKRLASSKAWWGESEDEPVAERRVIRCRRVAGSIYSVVVRDAIGVVAVGELQIVVRPKIDEEHFFYLLAASRAVPRFDAGAARLASSESLWDLVARWCTDAVETLLRNDLIKDYREETAYLRFIRGRALELSTARAFYAGRLGSQCRYEEFDANNPLNRVLKAAITSVVASPLLDDLLRRRAARLLNEFADLGDLRPGDLTVSPDLRSAHYQDAWTLSKLLLDEQGVTTSVGQSPAWTFLIRTPELVESGLRNLLQDGLRPTWHLEKRRKYILGAPITLNPDLVFEQGRVVGDVKYKVLDRWHQSDLYQAIAFATGHRALGALIISFSTGSSTAALPSLVVGVLPVHSLVWCANDDIPAARASARLIAEVKEWLRGVLDPEPRNEYR